MLVEMVGALEAAEGVVLEAEAIASFAAATWRRWFGRGAAPSDVRLRHRYLVERSLAERLRSAPADVRAAMYAEVYDQLFRLVPHHPQLVARRGFASREERARGVEREWRFLRRFLRPGRVFMEVGAGDCALALRAAREAARVYAVDVSQQAGPAASAPANFELRLTHGTDIPVDGGKVDLAFSDQLIEHLHADDAADHLREVRRSLAPGGVYVCCTPSRLDGPHDVSGHFDDEPRGLHLQEYSARELRPLLLACGFRRVHFYAGARGRYVRVPYLLLAAAETVLEALPVRLRKPLAACAPVKALLGLRAVARK